MVDFSYIQNRQTLTDFEYQSKIVCVRVDYNVPVSKEGIVMDDTRIRESLPTIRYILEQGGKVVLISHFKRPKGWDCNMSLHLVVNKVSELLGITVKFLEHKIGSLALSAEIQAMHVGDIVLLENIRFYDEETKNDRDFAKQIAGLCDIYINDAFGTLHRSHASTVGVAEFIPVGLGLLPSKELDYVNQLVSQTKHPLTVILAGGKTSTKINLLKGLMDYSDNIIIGGGMVFTFFKAMGYQIGKSLYEEETLSIAQEILKQAAKSHAKLHFPVDIVCAKEIVSNTTTQTFLIEEGIPSDMMGLDIGAESEKIFAEILKESKTIFWNGPVGVFEVSPFDSGTKAIAQAIGEAIDKDNSIMTLIGGGESAMAAKQYGIANKVTHMSTGGGALLELLEGVKLPGILAINKKL